MQPPVIVIPGITASLLRDEYAVTPDAVWSLLQKKYDRIMLHPDDLRYEGIEPARVRADQVFPLPYDDLIGELRHNLTQREDRPVPVYRFPTTGACRWSWYSSSWRCSSTKSSRARSCSATTTPTATTPTRA